jgi:hypothetical protein
MADAPRADGSDEEFGVRLDWPADPIGEPYEPVEAKDAAGADAEVDYRPPTALPAERVHEAPVLPRFEQISADLDTGEALARIAARVDALTAVTATFRNHLADRVSGAESRLVGLLQMRTDGWTQIEARLDETLRGLHRRMDDLTSTLSELVELHAETDAAIVALTEDVHGLRRRISLRGRGSEADQAGNEPRTERPVAAVRKSGSPRTRRPSTSP